MLAGDLLTTKEAAELLRVSPWTISAWLSQGKLRRTKAGGRTLISIADIEDFIRKSNDRNVPQASVAEYDMPIGGCARKTSVTPSRTSEVRSASSCSLGVSPPNHEPLTVERAVARRPW